MNAMDKFNRQQIDDMLLLFSRNQEMTFHTNCLQICMKCQILFSGKKNKQKKKTKRYFKMPSAEFFPAY